MTDRRAELERKRIKLALMREEKERRRREKEKEIKETEDTFKSSKTDIRDETEKILSSLGIPLNDSPGGKFIGVPEARLSPVPDHNSIPAGQQLVGKPSKYQQGNFETEDTFKSSKTDIRDETEKILSSLGIPLNDSPGGKFIGVPEARLSPVPDHNSIPAGQQLVGKPSKKLNLTVVNVHQTNIPPKENVSYNKQTQTSSSSINDRDAQPLDYYVIHWDEEWDDEFQVLTYADMSVEEDGEGSSLPSHDLESFAHPPHKVTGLPHVEMVRPAHTPDTESAIPPGEIVKEEKKKAREFSEEEKKQIMMREDFQNFFDRATRIIERVLYEDVDICVDYTGGGEEQEGDDKSGIKLSLNRYFVDDHWSKNRTVTSFDWSSQVSKFQSAVMSSCFAKFHPNLVIGGTYSGQIVLWDNRSNKRTPVQRSPLSAAAHTHPVYCVQVVGTQNAHNLVSISTDGKFCSWSLDMLSAPQDSMELSQQKQSRPVAVTCLTFPYGDFNNFVVGSEEGAIYTACRHGSKAGILDMFEGHQGPVTGIDAHTAQGQIDFSHLFLTSSFDWTVKLWSLKENKPLYSFEDNGDYVYDLAWSPIHPALFACVDGMGRLDIWNLNNDTELPTISIAVEGNPALNRVIWTPSGHQVTIGDDMGKIWIYDVGEQLATPKIDEWSRFVHTLQEIKNNQADQDMDAFNPLSSSPFSSSPIR
ncbi:cytoplasmic dynein 1 intermediate chain 2-like [Centruroides sculpturatus]|uniref:cytoplasmic dynein 1 intermediate chain 2-like n=1 Tax=Centruroides sculpturatus TaxID=218467 RepID=UPI000C6D74D3|nr:cytoplasmic dynein 1 intermediate chain 2-like [Centruroides sculpturatus]